MEHRYRFSQQTADIKTVAAIERKLIRGKEGGVVWDWSAHRDVELGIVIYEVVWVK